jgi:ABC-type transport system involved in cytochrome c biogenesis permease subunit
MIPKTSLLAWMMYGAMALYAAAVLPGGSSRRRFGRGLFAGGFILALAAVAWRGFSTGHAPFQNLFEIFLAMGALIYPLARLWRPLPGGESRSDPLLGLLMLWPAAFVFPERPRPLPPALQSALFIPHVAVYLAAYILLFKAAILASVQYRRRPAEDRRAFDRSAQRLAEWGYPLLTLGLLLGAWWGKRAWGSYWHWDPKELWALATWLIYTGYFHARTTLEPDALRTRAGLLIAGALAIVLTVTWVNLSRLFPGLHNYAM